MLTFKTKPYKHQLECLNKFGKMKTFALLAEMGTGKTWIIINNVAQLWEKNECDAMLVLAPNGVHTNWTRLEIPQHMPDEILYKSAAWIANGKKEDREAIRKLYKPFKCPNCIDNCECHLSVMPDPLRILTMNWDALRTVKGFEAALQFVISAYRPMIVCDESDSIKNPKAKRTKSLMLLKKYSEWRRIMTGTPINNAPFDLFSQFSFLNEYILQTTSFYAFKAEYAQMLPPDNALVKSIRDRTKFTPQIVAKGIEGKPKYRNLDKLSELIAPHSFRILKSECLDLPDKIYKTLFFDLTSQQKKIYKKAKQECRLIFENEETPFTKLVAMQKLAQITSGYYLHPLAKEPVRIEGENPKLNLAIDRIVKIVEEDNQVIIWARYRVEIEDIIKRLNELKISSVQLHGDIKIKDREVNVDAFQNGEASVFVGNQQAGGMGITLTAASYVIYFSNSFSYRDRSQSEDRAHRIGQVKNVTYINIAAIGTIDEVIIGALMNKKDVADTIIDKGLELFK